MMYIMLSRRSFLKIATISPILTISGSSTRDNISKDIIYGIIDDDEFRIKEDKRFKITDRFSSVRTFASS